MTARFATLTFERQATAPPSTLWHVWMSPAARAIWGRPSSGEAVDIIAADTRAGGREVSLCRVSGQPDIRVESCMLDLEPELRSVNSELVSKQGGTSSAALITAEFAPLDSGSRVVVTVQLSALAEDVEDGYRQGFDAGLENLVGVAERTMVLKRLIRAPRQVVWGVWMNPETLPEWWGPDGFSCRTSRIDLRAGGEWLFDMIAPDGTVFPNHHLYGEVHPEHWFGYQLLWGENGPKHADAWASFEDVDGATEVTLGMIFSSAAEFQEARGFGAERLGLQTLGKLARVAEAA